MFLGELVDSVDIHVISQIGHLYFAADGIAAGPLDEFHETFAKRSIFAPSIAAYSQYANLLLNTLPLLPSWELKIALFARGLKLCKTLYCFLQCRHVLVASTY